MPTRDGFTRCSKCGSQFQSEHFAAHQTIHEREDVDKLKESQANPFNASSSFFEPIAANLDATKNIGFVIRERGKYGSHAGHDGFDDESES
jgi:hypothetical protein